MNETNERVIPEGDEERSHLVEKLGAHFLTNPGVLAAWMSGEVGIAFSVVSILSIEVAMQHPEWGRAIAAKLLGEVPEEERLEMGEHLIRCVPVEVVG